MRWGGGTTSKKVVLVVPPIEIPENGLPDRTFPRKIHTAHHQRAYDRIDARTHLRVFRKVADFVNAQVLEELHLGLINLAVGSRNMTAKEPRLLGSGLLQAPGVPADNNNDDNRPSKAR